MMLCKLKILCSLLFLTAILLTPSLKAEPVSQVPAKPLLDHAWRKTEYPPLLWKIQALYPPGTNPRVYQDVDVSHYTIDAEFFLGDAPYPDNAYLEAVTTIDAKATNTLDELVIDFYDNITINDIWLNAGAFTNYTRSDDKIWMDLTSDPLAPDEVFEIKIDYNRVYGPAYQGLMFRTHGDSDTPAICSIDQPYLSPGWWPCFDIPYDKATADIYITCPDWMTAVSNGLLQSETDNLDGTKTFYWKEGYPLYTSVLSVAMTDYTTWTDTYVSPLDATEMPLVYYAFPEDAAKAMVDFDVSKDALVYFAQIYGEYPFIDEKYGVAETPNRFGSMEHQTITSLTVRATQSAVNWDVIVHEAAHQWWGDWVTCDTWNHVWLHEGFATYSEVLFNEDDTGEPAGAFLAANYDDGLYDGNLAETVYTWDEDLDSPFHHSSRIYDKGGWVLHMLRYIIDDDTSFFNAMKAYGQAHAHSTAVTDDLKAAMVAEYGSSLDDFFDQWLYTPYRPIYSIIYENSGTVGDYKVYIYLRQTHDHWVVDISENPLRDYYIMPIEFTVHYTDETTETFKVTNDQRNQSFQLSTSKEPDHTVFDEDLNILKKDYEEPSDNDGIPLDGDLSGIPGDNPCTGGATENCDDNCPDVANLDQSESDGDCIGDACDEFPDDYDLSQPDSDNDVIGDICDNCPSDNNPGQEDSYPPGGNNCGDVCECEGDFESDGDVDGSDAYMFKLDFGRMNCSSENPCNGNFDCDGNVDGSDAFLFKQDFGRMDCPICTFSCY